MHTSSVQLMSTSMSTIKSLRFSIREDAIRPGLRILNFEFRISKRPFKLKPKRARQRKGALRGEAEMFHGSSNILYFRVTKNVGKHFI